MHGITIDSGRALDMLASMIEEAEQQYQRIFAKHRTMSQHQQGRGLLYMESRSIRCFNCFTSATLSV